MRVNRVKKRKSKCSGKIPCERCVARQVECVFRELEKVLVSESYLQKLQDFYASMHNRPNVTREEQRPTSEADLPSTSRDVSASGEEHITNPLVSTTSFYMKYNSGYYRFCGPSSTWSFSQRIFILLKRELPDFPAPELPFHLNGSTWDLKWSRTTLDSASVLEGLLSLSDSLYLLNVVKYHSYYMIFLFDMDDFVPDLYELYERGVDKAKEMPLWFVQYLLIIALAKALLAASRDPKSPPGAAFFERAMSLMPDFVGLHRHPNLGMQVLYLTGFYLISVDMKDAAYAYIGQALRMCLIEGLYRDPLTDLFGVRFANQCRNIWWTTYVLERQVSALIGAPCCVQDAEVTCSLPVSYHNSEMAIVLTMHAKLSRIVGDVLNSVYTADIRRRRSFISTMQSVLNDMAIILRELDETFTDTAHPSLRTVSTMSSHLYLRYHQCIILATRPLFLYLLRNKLRRSSSHQDNHAFNPPQLRPLLETTLQSAKISIRTLLMLYEQSSLESFLPFDLDSIISSAFIIVLAAFFDPSLLPDLSSYTTAISRMLNDLIAKGNMAAQMRKKELDLLQQMTQRILDNERNMNGGAEGSATNSNLDQGITTHQDASERVLADDGIGMSYTQVLSLAQQLDTVNHSVWGTDFEFEYSNIRM